ncbi:hypothetical protein CAPTEDRAFT_158105 [Capitella teleta]|uniref:Aspartyl aminopeptidase n=1 Tax=Capitella teleta TaxID=283909 RepID=R7UV75_CAPTE|nr:hypothetical protein CAPTEDRAFT_158105 [Capitella teleta]|eukprot:ELU07857.1 hypothetical protein CAPTEDRAFT_158105 [Capitella teleta]
MASSKEVMKTAAKEFLTFVNKSPSPFHAVEESRQRLLAAGFKELREQDHWNIQPLDKFFVTRNQSSLLAFAVGGKYKPGNGFTLIGAHTDSPCLKVKPVSRRVKEGFIQVGVECYGGGTWHTWTDRDLKVAGRVLVKNGKSIEHRLVDIDRPILRVPNLAIHLNRDLGSKFEFNKEEHLTPVLATCVQEQLETGLTSTKDVPDGCGQDGKHHPVLVELLSQELRVSKENILDFELCLADHVPATLGGAFEEFIFAPRLDNLHSSFCALKGLVNSCGAESLINDVNIRAICLFDNEEVGSQSAQGAGSMILEHLLRRISTNKDNMTAFEEAIPQSLMLSADMAHGVHPNYSSKHEDQHRPALHKGVVIKFNANQRYATTSITTAILREVAARATVPIQDFVVRNDSPCGSTIGPIMSAGLGMPTIDIGCAQLSMHSIREMCDISSVKQSVDLFTTFFEIYPEVFASMKF